MSRLRARLAEGPPLLLDGGMGSMLLDRGLPAGQAPELWNLERPEVVTAIHRAYVEAGSEAVHTNTFGATPIRLAGFGLADRVVEVNHAAVQAARASGASLVVGDVGPSGEYLPPVGSADAEAWHDAFLVQGHALAEAGVDGFHVETMSDLREALVALRALRQAAPAAPVMVSLTFDRKRRGFFTVMGNRLAASLQALAEAGADAVGANCSITSPDMRDLATEALAAVQVPIVLQPNAGQPEVAPEGVRYLQEPQAFAADLAAIADAGVRVVGGCCGTDPRFVAALRARLPEPPT